MQPALRLTDLTLGRVDQVSGRRYTLSVPLFEASRMDRIGLVGQSGSGKSTLLEILGLLAWPDRLGSYDIAPLGDGRMMDLRRPMLAKDTETLTKVRSRLIGFVLQDGGLLPYLTVGENAELAAELSTGLTASARSRIKALAKEMGIGDYLSRLPSSLSGGQRQRSAVLRALAPNVTLLLADEPTASLDARTAEDVMQTLVRSAEHSEATLIVASHDTELLKRHGFRRCEVQVTGNEADRHASVSLTLPAEEPA